MPKGIKKRCSWCGRVRYHDGTGPAWRIKMFKEKTYCDRACSNNARTNKPKGTFGAPEKNCEHCHRKFKARGSIKKFCSRKCAGLAITTVVHSPQKCKNCYKDIPIPFTADGKIKSPSTYIRKKFCSAVCRKDMWPTKYRAKRNDSEIGRNAFRLRLHKIMCPIFCNRCRISINRVPLVMHHIDEDWRNNDTKNIEILCRPCHQSHHMQGSKWSDVRWKKFNIKRVKEAFDVDLYD